MNKRIIPVAAALLFALCGCLDIDYVGQNFGPTPDSQEVLYYTERKQVPVDEYTIIGRITINAPSNFTDYETEEVLRREGRKYGADAVCLAEVKKIRIGAYVTEDTDFATPSPGGINPSNMNLDGAPAGQFTTFGSIQQPLQGEGHFRTEQRIRALVLKDRRRTEELMKR